MTGQFRDSGRRGRANTVSRRAFGQLLVGATAAAAVPLFVPSRLKCPIPSACIVSWIAMKLGRPVTWDARAERFVNDPHADAMLARHERAPYGVEHLLQAAKWQPTSRTVAANSPAAARVRA
jgi:hypothetical protein